MKAPMKSATRSAPKPKSKAKPKARAKQPPSSAKASAGARARATPAISRKSGDATAMLRADHVLVAGLFADYENTRSTPRRTRIVAQICSELSVHAQVEEEIFYPAVKAALKDRILVPEATVEHASLRALIAELEGVAPVGEMFDARMKVLSEYVKHHVKEEQSEMFPKARATRLDLHELGAAIAARKAELMAMRATAAVR